MSCEAGARASIRPTKSRSSLGKRSRSFARSPLQFGSLMKKSCRRQKLAFSPKLSPVPVLAFDSRAQRFCDKRIINQLD